MFWGLLALCSLGLLIFLMNRFMGFEPGNEKK
jgi:hypothetical protein